MKKHILKYLIALNFLILAMPFFQTCSNDSIVIEEAEKNLHNKKMHTPSQTTEKDRADAIEKSQQESTINGYQLFYDSISKFNFSSEDISTISFLVAPLLNLILFLFCFAKKQKLIMVFSVLQLLSTISGLIILFFISKFFSL